MPDREKVIKEFELFIKEFHPACTSEGVELDMLREVLSLLKEQEAVEPNVSDINDHDAHGSWWYQCGKCKMPIDYGDRFCRRCGRAVKWT